MDNPYKQVIEATSATKGSTLTEISTRARTEWRHTLHLLRSLAESGYVAQVHGKWFRCATFSTDGKRHRFESVDLFQHD